MAMNINTIKRANLDRFYEEQYKVRRDFDQIFKNPNASQDQIEAMINKYELFIEENFEPYAAMHESR